MMEKEKAGASKDSFLFLSASTVQCYCCCHQRRTSKEVANKRILITNPQGRPGHFEKGLRCLNHVIQVFEETNSVCFETLKYQGAEVKNIEFQLKNLLHSALRFHAILLYAALLLWKTF